jgi:Fic family protein
MYVWEQAGWPQFEWNDTALIEPLAAARLSQGRLLGRMQSLGFDLQLEAQLQALTEDVLKSSEIEGDILDPASVRSSLARRLGVPQAAITPADRRTEGVVEMMLEATRNFDAPLTAARLFGWQAALFPTGYSGLARIRTGSWRDDADGPMQVVSGAIGREHVHYQAPPAVQVEADMAAFFEWFAAPPATDGLLRAGLAHLWFVTIHPFEDGNGRIARAIADQALAQSEGSPQRFYSMSSQIRREREDYYAILERTQSGGLDVTRWLQWFLACFTRAIAGAEASSTGVLHKAEFWQANEKLALTGRQRAILNRYLDGFEGNLTARKWAILGKCSPASAQRDIADLVEKGVLERNAGGSKNTSYALKGPVTLPQNHNGRTTRDAVRPEV